MTDRNELAKLYGKSKEFLIGKDKEENERAKITITPLSIDDMDLFNKDPNASAVQQKEQTMNLLSKSMGVEVSDLKSVSVEFLEEIFDCVMEINNFNKSDKLMKLKEQLKK